MIVCICHHVSERDIAQAVQSGCYSFEELQRVLAVATTCGKCHDCARETFHRHAAHAAATPHATDCSADATHGRGTHAAAPHLHVVVAASIA